MEADPPVWTCPVCRGYGIVAVDCELDTEDPMETEDFIVCPNCDPTPDHGD